MTTSEEVTAGAAEDDATTGADADAAPALAVETLSKTYGSGEAAVTAVEDVTFSVQSGTVVGLLGPNGAGKTTTIKSILGLVVPTAGTVEVGGIDVHERRREVYRRVGAMLEGARNVYWKLTVRENLEFFAAIGGESPAALRERHDELLAQLDLADEADTPVNDLSQGQKQKVSLACALARDVDVAFLDEPTLGLDVESSRRLRAEIERLAAQEGTTIVLSSHDMDVVEEVCDRVIIVNEGRVVADDDVDALVDVFRTQAYRIEVEGDLDAETRSLLSEGFGVDEVDSDGPRHTFEVALHERERYSTLIDDLRDADLTIVETTSIDPDLEEVFLELTGGGETSVESPADDDEPPADEGESPANGGELPADDDESPADEGESAADDGESPMDGGDSPADDDESAADIGGERT